MLLGKAFILLNSIHNPKQTNKVLLDFAHLLFWKVICCEQASNKSNVDFKHWHLWILWKHIEKIHIHVKLYSFQYFICFLQTSWRTFSPRSASSVLTQLPSHLPRVSTTETPPLLSSVSQLSKTMGRSHAPHACEIWNRQDVWRCWLFSPPESLTSRILELALFPPVLFLVLIAAV